MKTLLLIALLFAGCEKADMALLSGEYARTVKTPYGTLTDNISFEDGNYILDSYLLSPDRLSLIQMCDKQHGTYESKGTGFALKPNGQNFFWATHGKVDGAVLILTDALNKDKMVFLKQ